MSAANLLELGDRVLRSWWTIVAGVCIGLAGAVATLAYMPKVYQTTTRIWVSPQEIPEDVVRPTVQDDLSERLLTFRNAVLGQPYMEELIERTFGVPESEDELRRLADHIKNSVHVEGGRDRRSGVTFFSLTYRDVVPERASGVVNSLTELYVEQNARFRIERTERSYEQLAQMANDAKAELDEAEQALAAFNKRHPFAERSVETHLELIQANMAEVTRIGGERARLEEDISALQQELRRAGSSPTDSIWEDVTPDDPLAEQLALARRELEDMRSRLTEQHPDFRLKTAQVAELERRMASRSDDPSDETPGDTPEDPLADPGLSQLERQIASKQRELQTLEGAERRLLKENVTLRARIDGTTEVAPRLRTLLEEKRIAEDKYRSLQARAEEIKTSRDIERRDLGEKMEVLEYAKVPMTPVAPDPMQVHLLGLSFGCLLFVGPVLARHLLNPVIGSESGLVAVAEFPIVVTIPRIETLENAGDTRRLWMKNILLSVLAFGVLGASYVWWG